MSVASDTMLAAVLGFRGRVHVVQRRRLAAEAGAVEDDLEEELALQAIERRHGARLSAKHTLVLSSLCESDHGRRAEAPGEQPRAGRRRAEVANWAVQRPAPRRDPRRGGRADQRRRRQAVDVRGEARRQEARRVGRRTSRRRRSSCAPAAALTAEDARRERPRAADARLRQPGRAAALADHLAEAERPAAPRRPPSRPL